MRKLVVLWVALFASFAFATAQNGMKPVADVDALLSKIKVEMQKVSSLQSDFKQVKHISAMKGDVTSTGKFYYSKTNKVCLEYTTPMKYLIVINDSKIMMDMNGKKTVYEVSSNGLMREMVTVISSCMTGNLQALNSNYKMQYYQNATEYLVKVFPLNATAKKYIEEVDIRLLKSDLSVSSMKMVEPSKKADAEDKDFTEYIFLDKKMNVTIPASKFSVRK
ncbi:MAG: outer membrane lipoprotein carrier protein LolA [Prevotellaceae bacterium]|nr:outer membrane lipoprotein carrier protein LolA [Prevotellaceae bacterium]